MNEYQLFVVLFVLSTDAVVDALRAQKWPALFICTFGLLFTAIRAGIQLALILGLMRLFKIN